jgi:hypothetical protein
VDETATDSATFFGPPHALVMPPPKAAVGRADPASTTIAAMALPHPPRPPSIDQGVIATIWAVGLGIYIYFGLLAVGASGATAIVIALVSFAGIWLLVRLRGEEPVRRPRRRRS